MQFIKKRKLPTALFICLCSIGILVSITCMCLPPGEISLPGRCGALGVAIFFTVLFIWGILEWRYSQAGISISEEGFTDRTTLLSCGFIPWSHVKKITIASSRRTCHAIFIFNDNKTILDQSPGGFTRFINVLFFYFIGSPVRINMQGYKLKAQEIADLLESTYGRIGFIEYVS